MLQIIEIQHIFFLFLFLKPSGKLLSELQKHQKPVPALLQIAQRLFRGLEQIFFFEPLHRLFDALPAVRNLFLFLRIHGMFISPDRRQAGKGDDAHRAAERLIGIRTCKDMAYLAQILPDRRQIRLRPVLLFTEHGRLRELPHPLFCLHGRILQKETHPLRLVKPLGRSVLKLPPAARQPFLWPRIAL